MEAGLRGNNLDGSDQNPHQTGWPQLNYETLTWESSTASFGPAAAEWAGHRSRYRAAVPPQISDLTPEIGREIAALAREAETALIRFDAEQGHRLRAFGPILLRSEAASSSQIENLTASARAIFTAELGATGARNATLIHANTQAMLRALELADDLSEQSIRAMHATLMADQTRHTPGLYRAEAVWIGTSSVSPIGAEFVPPHHDRILPLMEDLSSFARRYDLPTLTQVAIAHAQFETIHPFTDGNGRTGRALAQAMLRRARITRNVTVPVSAGLLASVDHYHSALTDYRAGNPTPIVEQFAGATLRAIPNAEHLVGDLDRIRDAWQDSVRPRKSSIAERLLDYSVEHPALTAERAATALGIPATNIYRYLRQLQDAGVLSFTQEHRGPSVYRAQGVLDAIDAFAARAGRRSAR